MQAGMGLTPIQGSPVGMMTPSPADTSLRLMSEAQQHRAMSHSIVSAASISVGRQFQTQFQGIQSQQSMSPYAAQALSRQMPGSPQYQGGYMPSPITMTPPSTGVFRPPAQQPSYAPIPPMHVPQQSWSPFTPQMPAPMFTTMQDQQASAADINANRNFAYAAQAPGVLGQGMGYGAGAMMGARMGARFGGAGALIGAGVGAIGAGMTGIPQALGNMGQHLMGPAIESRKMGAALQNASRDWVTQGPQLHSTGRGLSQDASMDLAGELRDLAGNKGFQQQTGKMFNRADLMQITQQGGQSGLLDSAQTIPEIKNKVRETAQTIKQFMQLTNDPDVANVIRQLGQMHQMGMTQNEMVSAAQGMREYARQAGTTAQGLQEVGGRPGAMTFQQAGLTAGTGFQYGNYAAATARQTAASGNMSPRQLALMGGVHGMAQRDIQAQAAFSSMPLYGAMNAQYGGGSWGVNSGVGGQAQGGAFGMVNGAMNALNQGVRQGGVGALAMFPLQQREIADEAAANLTPEQQMAQRFQMATSTGSMLGLEGMGGFATGARAMYGNEVAEQMMYQARSPNFWSSQRQGLQRRKFGLAMSQDAYRRSQEKGPLGQLGSAIADATPDLGVGKALRGMRETVSGKWGRMSDSVSNWMDDTFNVPDGVYRRRTDKDDAITSRRQRALIGETDLSDYGPSASAMEEAQGGVSFSTLGRTDPGESGGYASYLGKTAINAVTMGGGEAVSDWVAGAAAYAGGRAGGMTPAEIGRMADTAIVKDQAKRTKTISMLRGAKRITDKQAKKSAKLAGTLMGGDADKGYEFMSSAADQLVGNMKKGGRTSLVRAVLNGDPGASSRAMTTADVDKAIIGTMAQSKGISEAQARKEFQNMKPTEQKQMRETVVQDAGRIDEDFKEYATELEGDMALERAETTEEALEAVRGAFDTDIEAVESRLGFRGALWDDAGSDAFRSQIKDTSTADAVLMAAAAQGKLTGKPRERAKAAWKRAGGKGVFGEELRKKQAAYAKLREDDEDVADIYKQAGASGTGFEDIRQLSGKGKAKAFEGAVRSESFLTGIRDFADPEKLEQLMQGKGAISMKALAGTMSEEGLEQMRKEGLGEVAKAYSDVRKGKKGAEAKLRKMVLSAGGGGEIEDSATVSAEGKEAAALEDSDKAMQNMQAAFADFKPAAREFLTGSRMLREAMDSQLLSGMRED